MAGGSYAPDDRESFQTMNRWRRLYQSSRSHHFHFARELPATDLEESIRLRVRRLQKLMHQM
jgi:hypothetical protein